MSAKSADAAATVRLIVNGTEHEVSAPEDTPLLYVLRNQLGLKAAHFGCGTGQCGACRVLINGQAVASCDTPLWAALGKRITTVEGLGNAAHPHPLQSALITEQAGQCGYCLPGILISAAAGACADAERSRGARGAGPEPVPLRLAQPYRARGAARGARGSFGMGRKQRPQPQDGNATGREWRQLPTLLWRESVQWFGGDAT